MKKIEFILSDEKLSWTLPPYPAINDLPNWYKLTESFHDGSKSAIGFNNWSNMTVKKCIPFRDAISLGYFIPLSADIYFHGDKNITDYRVTWATNTDIVKSHMSEQYKNFPIPDEFEKFVYKFEGFYIIKTPPGYSTLFLTPMIRDNQPFFIIPGVVDTDKHNVPINFPFLIRKDFVGEISRGTPIIQALPFKRENWKSSIAKKAIKDLFQRSEERHSTIDNFYKINRWTRKEFK